MKCFIALSLLASVAAVGHQHAHKHGVHAPHHHVKGRAPTPHTHHHHATHVKNSMPPPKPGFHTMSTLAPTPQPIHCKYSSWSAYTRCPAYVPKYCNTKYEVRSLSTRSITRMHNKLGSCHGSLSRNKPCVYAPCKQDCKTTSSGWSKCSRTCGKGVQVLRRKVTQTRRHGGKACKPQYQKKSCILWPCPINCQLAPWTVWTPCSKSCGPKIGTQSRKRMISVFPARGGRQCGKRFQVRACNKKLLKCQQHCYTSKWSRWGGCSKSCGGGKKWQTRTIIQNKANGGKNCPNLRQFTLCNVQKCPIDCVVGKFLKWESCSKKCGKGVQLRRRKIMVYPAWGGKKCGPIHHERRCNSQKCRTNCVVSAWADWSACAQTCGKSFRSRARVVLRKNKNSGVACPHLRERRGCDAPNCPVNCLLSKWSSYSACTRTCGTGIKHMFRKIITQAAHGGRRCRALRVTAVCKGRPCPIDCVVNSWGPYGACKRGNKVLTCGRGRETRTRSVNIRSRYGGKKCPHRTSSKRCSMGPCPIHCRVSTWGKFSKCQTKCGVGTQHRRRKILQINKFKGHVCPSLHHERECITAPCRAPCKYTAWSTYTRCSKSCGGGYRTRFRSVTFKPVNGGRPCGSTYERVPCINKRCPVDCAVGKWSGWTKCNKPCGRGTRIQTRKFISAAKYGGSACPSLRVKQYCNLALCAIHCTVSKWSVFTKCSKSCGAGISTATRTIKKVNRHGGRCPALKKYKKCGISCPVDCKLSGFKTPGPCQKRGRGGRITCGYGQQTITRTILRQPRFGGIKCAATKVVRSCAATKCPINCKVTPYGAWSKCSRSCGAGFKLRVRKIIRISKWGGHVCPRLRSCKTKCQIQECPRDCKFYAMGLWSKCSSSCGKGVQTRSRSIFANSKFGGKQCPTIAHRRSCFRGHCPVHCSVSRWSSWTKCSSTCGIGRQVHTRKVTKFNKHGGHVCPILTETRQCLRNPCPTDCKLTSWRKYGKCSQSCSSGLSRGYKMSHRAIVTGPRFGGKACAPRTRRSGCGMRRCPVNCQMHAWSLWGKCSAKCGYGKHSGSRTIRSQPKFGGKPCKARRETRTLKCFAGPCAVHCKVGQWGSFGLCNKKCGGGLRFRTREVIKKAKHGGRCPSLKHTIRCNIHVCNVDCKLGSWSGWNSCSKSCDAGKQLRTRQINVFPTGKGKKCSRVRHQYRKCQRKLCDRDCVSHNKGWGECSRPCNGGKQTEIVLKVKAAVANGDKCYQARTRKCNTRKCSIRNFKHNVDQGNVYVKSKNARTFKVSYTTGKSRYSASNSRMYIQFRGSKGDTPFMYLGNRFVKGQRASKSIRVAYKIGLLHGVVLKAGGADGWNPVNFINVATPNGNTVQFATDYFLSSHITKSSKKLYAPYKFGTTFGLRAVVPEEGTKSTMSTYTINVRTSTKRHSDSHSPMFLQLIGTQGRSNFMFLGSHFHKGASKTITVRTNNHIGLLREISVEAGGHDAWHPLGYITVKTPSKQKILFWTNFWLTDRVTNMPNYFFRDEVHAVKWETKVTITTKKGRGEKGKKNSNKHHGVKFVKKTEKNSKAQLSKKAAVAGLPNRARKGPHIKSFKFDYSLKHGAGKTSKIGFKKPTAKKTSAPTPMKWKRLPVCRFGRKSVPHGWVGSDPRSKKNYCNKCQCHKGIFKCTTRVCGRPWSSLKVPKTAKICSNTKCSASKGKKIVLVSHHHAERRGANHRCAYNKFTRVCRCYCWAPRASYITRVADKITIRSNTCKFVAFKRGFNPTKGAVRVIATAQAHRTVHAVVRYAKSNGFYICSSKSSSRYTTVNFYAYQGHKCGKWGMAPFGGSQSGTATVSRGCRTVKFTTAFDKTPIVVGSGSNGATWIGNVNSRQFKVCGTARNQFTYLAFEHKNPQLWYMNRMPYATAGTQRATGTCTYIRFRRSFTKAPKVMVNSNHKNSGLDWSGKVLGTKTSIKKLTKYGFFACAKGDRKTLKFDYVAFN